jgi:hypothetical protein
MAFELGLTVAMDRAKPGHHTWFVFEARRFRLDRSLSDLAGTDAHFHGARPAGVFRELANAFAPGERKATVQEMRLVFRKLQHGLPGIIRNAGARSPFTARVFSDLRVLAGDLDSDTWAKHRDRLL